MTQPSRLGQLMAAHNGVWWSEVDRYHCKCGELMHEDTYAAANVNHGEHLARLVRQYRHSLPVETNAPADPWLVGRAL